VGLINKSKMIVFDLPLGHHQTTFRPKHTLQVGLRTRTNRHMAPSSQPTNLAKRPASTTTREEDINALHYVINLKRRRLVCLHPCSSDSVVLDLIHVVRSKDHSTHDHSALTSEAVSVAIAEPNITVGGSISETVDSYIECFRSARELLNLQIEALEREQEWTEEIVCDLTRCNSYHV